MQALCQLQLHHHDISSRAMCGWLRPLRANLCQHAHRVRQEIRGGFWGSARSLLHRLRLPLLHRLRLPLHPTRRLCGLGLGLGRYKQRIVHLRRESEVNARKWTGGALAATCSIANRSSGTRAWSGWSGG
jgi:hypothetical protein